MTAGSPLMLHIILDPEALEALHSYMQGKTRLHPDPALERARGAVRETFTTSQTLVAMVRRSTATARSQP